MRVDPDRDEAYRVTANVYIEDFQAGLLDSWQALAMVLGRLNEEWLDDLYDRKAAVVAWSAKGSKDGYICDNCRESVQHVRRQGQEWWCGE